MRRYRKKVDKSKWIELFPDEGEAEPPDEGNVLVRVNKIWGIEIYYVIRVFKAHGELFFDKPDGDFPVNGYHGFSHWQSLP